MRSRAFMQHLCVHVRPWARGSHFSLTCARRAQPRRLVEGFPNLKFLPAFRCARLLYSTAVPAWAYYIFFSFRASFFIHRCAEVEGARSPEHV